MKQILSLILLLTLLFSFTACAGESEKKPTGSDTTNASQTVTTEPDENFDPLNLPELNYGGAKVRLISEFGDDNDRELLSAELSNEPINDAIYNRELFVEDLLSVELERAVHEDRVSAYLEKSYISGDIPGEIICAPCDDNIWRSPGGYYRDLRLLDNIDPTSRWWSQNFNDEISVCDLLFLTCGDLSLSMFRDTFVIFFNRDLAEDNGITGVYDTIFDGGWTIDVMTELSADIYQDLNGNSEKDAEDVYGFIFLPLSYGDPSWSAFDIDILSKDEDGFLVFAPDLDKFGLAHDKLCRLLDQKGTFANSSWTFGDAERQQFASGHAVFAPAEMKEAETVELRNMQQDYSILPMPKFDLAQKGYYTVPHDTYTTFGISSMIDDETAEMAAAVLEAMGWYSCRYVKPAYLDVAMKGKYANDQETRRMLDLVVDGLRIDAAWMYAHPLLDYPQTWRYLLSDRSMNYASTFAAKERNVKICLKELNESFAAMKNE